jgi:hypothetical protein
MGLKQIIDDGLFETKSFRSTGLLHPNGKVLECDFFQHLAVAKKNPDFLTEGLREKAQEYADNLKAIADECDNLAAQGEHPEWHNYEFAEADCNVEFLNDLYNAGYCRFYIHFKREQGQTFGEPQMYANVTLEGKKMVIHRDLIYWLQNKYRVKLNVEKTK